MFQNLFGQTLEFLYLSILASVIAIIFLAKYAKKQREEVGRHVPTLIISIFILFFIPFLSFLFGGVSLHFEIPTLRQMSTTIFNYKGGVSIIPELIALALALNQCTQQHLLQKMLELVF